MKYILSFIFFFLSYGCVTNFDKGDTQEYGTTVDYLGRKWPESHIHYNEKPDKIPEFVVRAAMKKGYIDAGDKNGKVMLASSFSPLLEVKNEPILLPVKFHNLLEKVLEENRPYEMNDIPWPFAPASHAYILLDKDSSSFISLTRYDNAFVIQHAFYASSPYAEGSVLSEFQSLGAWATWVESPELSSFLDDKFDEVNPIKSPYSYWLSNSPCSVSNQ